MEDKILRLIMEAFEDKNISYIPADDGRVIAQFNGDEVETVCMYRATESGVMFRAFYDLGNKVTKENRGNVLEYVNKMNSGFLEGALCVDEDCGIVYSVFLEFSGVEKRDFLEHKILHVLRVALETEQMFSNMLKQILRGNETAMPAAVDSIVNQNASQTKEADDIEFMSYFKKEFDRIRETLYGEDIPDNEVLNQVYVGERIYKNENRIANYAIMGGPGSGKTTLAKKLAKYYNFLIDDGVDVELMIRSGADLKGTHIGQTENRLFDLLKEASETRKIIFIDEAYQLLEDEFGREALTILLPIMSGDRREIEKVGKNGEKETFSFDSSRYGWVPPIWLGGYEKETRKMIGKNEGIYRRISMIVLSKPKIEDLYQYLMNLCKNNVVLRDLFDKEENQKEIKAYFAWGMQPEHIAYFACYAGVENLCDKLNAYVTQDMPEELKSKVLTKVMKDSMKDIERQCNNND